MSDSAVLERSETGEMCILDQSGDTKIIWDRTKAEEVEAARATFDSLKKKGYLAYTVNARGDKGEVIKDFDPAAEKIILSPQMKGG